MTASVKWIATEVDVPVGYMTPGTKPSAEVSAMLKSHTGDPMITEAVETGRKYVVAWIPDPENGLIVTESTEGNGWRITHRGSGYAIGLTRFPLIVAKKACLAMAAIESIDWKQPIEYLAASRERIFPLIAVAVEPYEGLQI